LEASAIAVTILIVDQVLKALPDDIAPKIGQDSVDERRLAAKKSKSQGD
jgi:hypothetical protein